MSDQEIARALASSRDHLDLGQEDQAESELQKILQSEPGHKAANHLRRQIREDPVAMLGRESFSYRVQPGDTLAGIAQRFLNDKEMFYALARYNNIKVPRQLPVGQTIRVPGKAPRTLAAPAPATPAAAAPAPAAQPAAQAPAPDPAVEAARAERERKAAVDRGTRQARASMARQDVCAAIAAWDGVLRIDPDNRTAQLEREKALELKKRLASTAC